MADVFDALRPQLAELCCAYGIRELAIFGSAARGEAGPDSDIDLVYVRAESTIMGFIRLQQLQEELESMFDRPVDIVPRDGLHWVIRDRVLADARTLFAAA